MLLSYYYECIIFVEYGDIYIKLKRVGCLKINLNIFK